MNDKRVLPFLKGRIFQLEQLHDDCHLERNTIIIKTTKFNIATISLQDGSHQNKSSELYYCKNEKKELKNISSTN